MILPNGSELELGVVCIPYTDIEIETYLTYLMLFQSITA